MNQTFQPIRRKFFNSSAEFSRQLLKFNAGLRGNFELQRFPIWSFDDSELIAHEDAQATFVIT